MSVQKKVILVAICVLLFLICAYLLLSRGHVQPGPTQFAPTIPISSPTPIDEPIPTKDPSINDQTIFELRPSQTPKETYDKNLFEALKKDELENHPDTVISNNTPYSTNRFFVTTDFVDAQGGYFVVKVTSVVEEDIKKEVHEWMLSLGLTEQAISKLTILYE